jgi:hypothetical protein
MRPKPYSTFDRTALTIFDRTTTALFSGFLFGQFRTSISGVSPSRFALVGV